MRPRLRTPLVGLVWLVSVVGVSLILRTVDIPDLGCSSRSVRRVLVLPLKTVAPAADELALGVSEEIATRLTQTDLQVIPWITSLRYRDSSLDPAQIAREVGADAVVHGTLDQAGGLARGQVQFTVADDGIAAWTHEFNVVLSDSRFVKRHIARGVVARITGEEPDADSSRELYERGSQAILTGDDETARTLYEMALERDPGFAEGYAGLGTLYYRRRGVRNLNEAVRNYETALSLSPGSMGAWQGLVSCYWMQGQSERCLQKARDVPAEIPEADRLVMKGWSYSIGELPDKSVPLLERAWEMAPDDPRTLWVLTNSYCGWDYQPEKGIRAGRTFLSRFGDDPQIHSWLGRAYLAEGRPDSALVHFGRAVELGAGLDTGLELAVLHLQMNHSQEAREVFEEERRRWMEKLAATPDDHYSRGLLARALAGLGDAAGAKAEAARIAEASSGAGHGLWEAGRAMAFLGEQELAVEYLRKAFEAGKLAKFGTASNLPGFTKPLKYFGFEGLVDNPRYLELVEDMRSKMDRLREEY